jgi:hypothetical protein
MKTFNAFQSVCFFVGAPFALSWVHSATFPGQKLAFWAGCVAYLVAFCLNVAAVRIALDKVDNQ